MSPLHAWIRFFECILHLSYKLEVSQWQARGEKNKIIMERNKKRIQEAFKLQMGLIVDKPKPVFGSTNDGNTARRFFNNPKTFSSITGVDEEIISRFYVILLTISSSYYINIEPCQNYCYETAQKFVNLYMWYAMPCQLLYTKF